LRYAAPAGAVVAPICSPLLSSRWQHETAGDLSLRRVAHGPNQGVARSRPRVDPDGRGGEAAQSERVGGEGLVERRPREPVVGGNGGRRVEQAQAQLQRDGLGGGEASHCAAGEGEGGGERGRACNQLCC